MPKIPIKPGGGVLRVGPQHPEFSLHRPYDMRNVRLLRGGGAEASRVPQASDLDLDHAKPWIDWGGHVLDRNALDDERHIHVAERFDSRLYVSTATLEAGLDFEDADPKTLMLESGWEPGDGLSANIVTEPARVTSFASAAEGVGGVTVISGAPCTGYLLIPINARGEAGEWKYGAVLGGHIYDSGLSLDVRNIGVFPMTVTAGVNDETVSVEVYRTMTLDSKGYVAGVLATLDATLPQHEKDHAWYYLGRYDAETVDGVRRVQFTDDNLWITARMMAHFTEESDEVTVGGTVITKRGVPQVTLDRRPNLHASAAGTYRGFAARTMFNHNGRMLYGDVCWPLKEPALILASGTGSSVILQYEYRSPDGTTVYGPPVTTNAARFSVPWQGERGLVVRTDATPSRVIERLVPDRLTGAYVSRYLDGGEAYNVTYAADLAYPASGDREEWDGDEAAHIQERNVVMLAAQDRPHELTYDNFYTDPDTAVNAILPARLDEQESLRAFDIYVCTNRTVGAYVYEIIGGQRTYVEAHRVSSSRGPVYLGHSFEYDEEYYGYYNPVVVSVKDGIVFRAGDQRLWWLRGRDLIDLEDGTEGLLRVLNSTSSEVWDLAYNALDDELWCLLGGYRIWVYSFKEGAWVANYFRASIGSGWWMHIWYSPTRRCVQALHTTGGAIGDDGTLSVVEFDRLTGDYAAERYIVTQRIQEGGPDLRVRSFQLDYDRSDYDQDDRSTWALVQHATLHDGVLQVDEYGPSNPDKVNITLRCPRPPRVIYPTALRGRGHQFHIEGFDVLREILIDIE